MTDIKIYSLPFALDGVYTRIVLVDHADWFNARNNKFYSYVLRKPIEQWLFPYSRKLFTWPGFLASLVKEINEREFNFSFVGLDGDYKLFREEILSQAFSASSNLRVSFSHELQDYDNAVHLMSDLLLMVSDSYAEGNNEISRAIYLRRKLNVRKPKPCAQIWRSADSEPSSFPLDNFDGDSDNPRVLFLLFDTAVDSMEKMLHRYKCAVKNFSPRELRPCIVTGGDLQAQNLGIEFIKWARALKQLPVTFTLCTCEDESEENFRLFLTKSYFEEIYRPLLLGWAADFISGSKARHALPIQNGWLSFCQQLEGSANEHG